MRYVKTIYLKILFLLFFVLFIPSFNNESDVFVEESVVPEVSFGRLVAVAPFLLPREGLVHRKNSIAIP